MHDKRPSKHELLKRLKEAKQFLKEKPGLFANPAKVMGELNKLHIVDSNDLWSLIIELLSEINAEDYDGSRPPQKSYEKAIVGCELFAFSWYSSKCKQQMYIKFALENERFYYLSLHQAAR